MNRVCVFCGSNRGNRPDYSETAQKLGLLLVERNLELVYGGGSVGLMGILADTVLRAGGKVTGVIPQGLFQREVAHAGLTELRFVSSMHQRKAMMADLSDCFIALPGGFGTLEEFCEIVTWAQLGIHQKACGLLNVNSYFEPLLAFLNHAVEEGFLKVEHRALILEDSDAGTLLDRLSVYKPPVVEKWIDLDQT